MVAFLLFAETIKVAPSPTLSNTTIKSPESQLLAGLSATLPQGELNPGEKAELLNKTKLWVRSNHEKIRSHLALIKIDPSYESWKRDDILMTWPTHTQINAGLFNFQELSDELLLLVDIDKGEMNKRYVESKDKKFVDGITRSYEKHGYFRDYETADQIHDIYMAAAVVRGGYHGFAAIDSHHIVQHRFRRACLPPIEQSSVSLPKYPAWIAFAGILIGCSVKAANRDARIQQLVSYVGEARKRAEKNSLKIPDITSDDAWRIASNFAQSLGIRGYDKRWEEAINACMATLSGVSLSFLVDNPYASLPTQLMFDHLMQKHQISRQVLQEMFSKPKDLEEIGQKWTSRLQL